MDDGTLDKLLMGLVFLGLISLGIVFAAQSSDCNGKMVRGVFWYECIE